MNNRKSPQSCNFSQVTNLGSSFFHSRRATNTATLIGSPLMWSRSSAANTVCASSPCYKRLFSSKTTSDKSNTASTAASTATDHAASEESALVLTPYEKVTETARATTYLGFLALALVCGFYIIRELLPTRMNPNSLFNEAVDQINASSDVSIKLGKPIRAYGRDHGGHREGRRNFIENVKLKDKDGTPRLRIKFNLKGQYGHAFGFAETRKGMGKGEWVYLIVQLTRTGEIITIQDNRQLLSADSKEEEDALRQLLQGGSSSSF